MVKYQGGIWVMLKKIMVFVELIRNVDHHIWVLQPAVA
jgi:hypothetical protein